MKKETKTSKPRNRKYKPRKPNQPPPLSAIAKRLPPMQRTNYRRARAEIQRTLLHLPQDAPYPSIIAELQRLLDHMQIAHSLRNADLSARELRNPHMHAPDRLTRCLCLIALKAVRSGEPAVWAEADAEAGAKDQLLKQLGFRPPFEGGEK